MNLDRTSRSALKAVNTFLLVVSILFAASTGLALNQYLNSKGPALESFFFPPTEDWTFRGWRREPDGLWSAEVYLFKTRKECVYVKDQVFTVTFNAPTGEIGESLIEFIGDASPGNSRPRGWIKLDSRVKFLNPKITNGTLLRGDVLHDCHPGTPIVSGFHKVVVGETMPWPPYVQEWIAAGKRGVPGDYR